MDNQKNNEENSYLIYKNVLENMQDGVITIDSQGKIIILNKAASHIFMFEEKNFIGNHFTTIFSKFLLDQRNDELNDAILNAIYESAITHHKEVKYYYEETIKDLLISATSLVLDKEGQKEKLGIILVFSDVTERQRLAHMKNLFGRYIDPHIAQRLMEQPEDVLIKSSRQTITVSFCDMNNFTTLCESLPPQSMVELMNIFFSMMSQPVHKNEGVIDKFIGDSIMSFWGFPFSTGDDHPLKGCQTALDQIEGLTEFHKKVHSILEPQFKDLNININIGIATGELIIGNIGSEELKSYTIMGNIVNLSARLVGANKIYGTSILLSDEVIKSAGEAFEYREIDTIRVKGKMKQTIIYELLGRQGSLSPEKIAFRDNYLCALNYYRQRNWQAAKAQFEQALLIIPQDKACQVFIDRIDHFKTQPLPESWDGVWVLDSK